MTRPLTRCLVVLPLLLVVYAGNCDDTNPTPTTPPQVPSDINNSWLVEGNPLRGFDLACDDCPAVTYPIFGNEFVNDGNGNVTESPVDGTVNNLQIRMTVQRAGGDETYTGIFFPDRARIELQSTSTSESLVLLRDDG